MLQECSKGIELNDGIADSIIYTSQIKKRLRKTLRLFLSFSGADT